MDLIFSSLSFYTNTLSTIAVVLGLMPLEYNTIGKLEPVMLELKRNGLTIYISINNIYNCLRGGLSMLLGRIGKTWVIWCK